jgi:hypothetical protein
MFAGASAQALADKLKAKEAASAAAAAARRAAGDHELVLDLLTDGAGTWTLGPLVRLCACAQTT